YSARRLCESRLGRTPEHGWGRARGAPRRDGAPHAEWGFARFRGVALARPFLFAFEEQPEPRPSHAQRAHALGAFAQHRPLAELLPLARHGRLPFTWRSR